MLTALRIAIECGAVLLAVAALGAGAQGTATATGVIEGSVYDSLALRPLSGATVQIRRRDTGRDSAGAATHTATTDARGRFRVENIPAGRNVAGFFHESLDSLGLDAPVREIRVVGSRPLRLSLGLPSARTIVTTLCGAAAFSDSTGTLIGFVRHARPLAAAERATVSVRWTWLVTEKERLTLDHPEATAQTRDNGWYALCNVPVGWGIMLAAAYGNDSSGEVEAMAIGRRVVRADLYVGESERIPPSSSQTRSERAPADSMLRRGPARLTVSVRTATGQPIAHARVAVAGSSGAAMTNDSGFASLVDLPAGSQTLDVRALGFIPVRETVQLLLRDTPSHTDVLLTSVRTFLDTVRVTGQQILSRDITGFEGLRRAGLGRYIDRAEIDRQRPFWASDLLRSMPAVQVVPTPFGAIVSMLGINGRRCRPLVFLDGARFLPDSNAPGLLGVVSDIDLLTMPDELEAVEVYTRAGQAPSQFTDTRGCGSVLLWTRRRPPQPER